MYIFEMMGSIGPTQFNDRGKDVVMLQSLLIQSGKPVGKVRTHDQAPRVLIANSNLV